MIEVKSVSKRFGDIEALKDISFEVPQGRILGFLGANGAGKTTTMDIICGCSGPDSGQVLVEGFDIATHHIEAKKRIGYLPDEPPLHGDMKVMDFLKYVGRLRGMSGDRLTKRIQSVMDRLSLVDVSHRYIGNLSKGFKQRVGLAQAIMHEPSVLVLDEPTEGLDPKQISEIRSLIQSLKGDHTIVLSSHILSEVESTCDDIAIIDQGRLLVKGSYDQLRSDSEKGPQFKLVVRSNPKELMNKINRFATVETCELTEDAEAEPVLHIRLLDHNSNPDDILKLALNDSHGVVGFTRELSSLEDVFMKLTRHDNQEVSA